MRMRAFVCSVLLSVLFCSLAFSSISAKAIDPADTLKLSNDMFFGMLGDSLSGQYLGTDGQMHSITFTKGGKNTNIAQTNMLDYTAADWQGYSCQYTAAVPADFYFPAPSSGEHSVLILSPNLHFQNISYCKFGLTWLNTDGSWQSAYNSTPYTNFSPYVYLHAGDSLSDTYSLSRRTDNTMGSDTWNSLTQTRNPFLGFSDEGSWDDFYLGDIYISPIGPRSFNNNNFYVFFVCPTFNSDYLYVGHGTAPSEPEPSDPEYSGDSATVTGTISDNGDGTQDVNITIEQDNSGLIGGILSGIRNLFVPSSEYFEDFTSDLQDEWSEHLGGISEAVDLIDDWKLYFQNAVARDPPSITFPELTIPLSDGDNISDYTIIQSQQVELKPYNTQNGLKVLWDAVAFAVDIVCVLAVLNMLQTKYEIFLNPDGEVIDYDN